MKPITVCLLVVLGLVSTALAQRRVHKVDCDAKKVIVDYHNELRKQIANGKVPKQPKSSDMQKLVWDDKLGSIAQKWANRKVFEHSDAKDSRFSVGENLYISMTSDMADGKVNWTAAIQSWFDEHKDYAYKPTESDADTGHYTQVIWAKTLYVGCGVSQYEEDDWLKKLYVCNYGPAGNYLGEYPYKKGPGCEDLCCSTQDCNKLYGDRC